MGQRPRLIALVRDWQQIPVFRVEQEQQPIQQHHGAVADGIRPSGIGRVAGWIGRAERLEQLRINDVEDAAGQASSDTLLPGSAFVHRVKQEGPAVGILRESVAAEEQQKGF